MTAWKTIGRPAAMVCALTAACTLDHAVIVTLDFTEPVPSEVEAFLVAIYRMDECPDLRSFTPDDSEDFLVHRQFFRGAEGDPIGHLDGGTYAFIGMALDSSCSALYAACEVEELSSEIAVGDYEVELEMYSDTFSWTCGTDLSCSAGVCQEPE